MLSEYAQAQVRKADAVKSFRNSKPGGCSLRRWGLRLQKDIFLDRKARKTASSERGNKIHLLEGLPPQLCRSVWSPEGTKMGLTTGLEAGRDRKNTVVDILPPRPAALCDGALFILLVFSYNCGW